MANAPAATTLLANPSGTRKRVGLATNIGNLRADACLLKYFYRRRYPHKYAVFGCTLAPRFGARWRQHRAVRERKQR